MESGHARVALVPAGVVLQPFVKSAGQLAPLSTTAMRSAVEMEPAVLRPVIV